MNALLKYSAYLIFTLLALAFAITGIEKLIGTPVVHYPFSILGTPEWFGYFIGGCELLGGIGLLLPRSRRLAAIGLSIIMLGAIYYHSIYAFPSVLPVVILLMLLILTTLFPYSKRSILKLA